MHMVLSGYLMIYVVKLEVTTMKNLDYKLDKKLVPVMEEVLVKVPKVKYM